MNYYRGEQTNLTQAQRNLRDKYNASPPEFSPNASRRQVMERMLEIAGLRIETPVWWTIADRFDTAAYIVNDLIEEHIETDVARRGSSAVPFADFIISRLEEMIAADDKMRLAERRDFAAAAALQSTTDVAVSSEGQETPDELRRRVRATLGGSNGGQQGRRRYSNSHHRRRR